MTSSGPAAANPAQLPMPQVSQALMTWGIIHEVLPCPDELSDTAAFCAHFNVPLSQAANTIVVTSRKQEPAVYAVCVVLGTTRLDTAVLEQERVIMGGGNRTSKLRLAPTELRKLPAVELVQGLAATKEDAPKEDAPKEEAT